MAKKSQCEQCNAFINECGLCRKEWKLAELNDCECRFFGVNETMKAVGQISELTEDSVIETVTNEEPLYSQTTELRKRHGCVTAWLASTLFVCFLVIFGTLTLLFITSPNKEQLMEYISNIISAGIILIAVILLYRGNVWGLYIIIGIAVLNILSIILLDGKISSLAAIIAAFSTFRLQAIDGYTFFDHLGVTSRRKRVQREQMSYYITHLKRKSTCDELQMSMFVSIFGGSILLC